VVGDEDPFARNWRSPLEDRARHAPDLASLCGDLRSLGHKLALNVRESVMLGPEQVKIGIESEKLAGEFLWLGRE